MKVATHAAFNVWLVVASILAINAVVAALDQDDDIHTNQWYLRMRRSDAVHDVADRHGLRVIGPVLGSQHEFIVEHADGDPHSPTPNDEKSNALKNDVDVEHAAQMTGFTRQKRQGRDAMELPERHRRGKPLGPGVLSAREKFKLDKAPTDPLYSKEWYLKNTGQAGGMPELDLNVEAAWAQGITGKGVTTAIMDDGIDYMHPDLYDNYNADASWDFSSNDPYPYPRYTDDWFNSHGTRCAGEIAAKRDNDLCGVGIAYNSKIAGLRMLDQPFMTDAIEAGSMGHRPDLIDIYSASWGPTDDGKTVDGPRNLTMAAIVKGINEGRKGKGSIYVWASGDGGPDDDCNCDGYAASMWTVSINSATNDGQTASYDESCSSTLASTFSNGRGYFDAGVATTDLYGNCTLKHSGTSAAAPEAAGIIALALEANPKLTWRDVQHLIVLTSKRNHLYDPNEVHPWQMNGAGLEYNHLFGFGVMDAGAIVDLAKRWHGLPERYHCAAGHTRGSYYFSSDRPVELVINTNACRDQKDKEVNFVEHVQSVISLRATNRGAVRIFISSPMNTTSMLLSRRPRDTDGRAGFKHWPFMTTHQWAENPTGQWRLRVEMSGKKGFAEGVLLGWDLELHGTKQSPYGKQKPESRDTKLKLIKKRHTQTMFGKAR